LLRAEMPTATPFPKPFKLLGGRTNYWTVEAVEQWLAAELAAKGQG
jgi:predicted DNA-binding transcriptional regulator AlpA